VTAQDISQQCRLVDGELDIAQSQTIVRYLGRKFDCYGSSEKERACIDMILDGIVSLRKFYLELVYTEQMVRRPHHGI
jgi:hypothetical protein